MILSEILAIYQGSDGDATKALFEKLKPLAPIGEVAINLFRAHKASARAKVYRGGGYKGAAYDKKNWAMNNLTDILRDHGAACAIRYAALARTIPATGTGSARPARAGYADGSPI